MAAKDTTYNGWTNYPTWAVNLWISNDQGLDEMARNAVRSIRRSSQLIHVDLADWFKATVEEMLPDLGASVGADLLGFAVDQVNWNEIASAWLGYSEEEMPLDVSAGGDC